MSKGLLLQQQMNLLQNENDTESKQEKTIPDRMSSLL
jgi:hypothetical protein